MAAVKRVSARALEKQEKALRLFLGGMPYEKVAEMAGYSSRGAAHTAVQTALRRHAAERDELAGDAFELQMGRYEAVFRSMFALAANGDTSAGGVCVRVLDSIGKLQGLEAPMQVSVSMKTELDNEIEGLLNQLKGAAKPSDVHADQ